MKKQERRRAFAGAREWIVKQQRDSLVAACDKPGDLQCRIDPRND
jgi:hypothetical protein